MREHYATEVDTAVRRQATTLFVSLELSRAKWLVTSSAPGSEKLSKHVILGGDGESLLRLLHRLQASATRHTGTPISVMVFQEAGLDGFWIHRLLVQNRIESHIVEPASIAVNRRHRRAKTDRIDGALLVRTLMAWARGERRVCSMVRPPTPEEEDRRRLTRERAILLKERIQHTNRIRGLLFGQGVTNYDPVRRDRRTRLEQLRTGDGRPLPDHLKAEILREIERLELTLVQLGVVEHERDAVVAETTASESGIAPEALLQLRGLTSQLWIEGLFRHFDNRRQIAAYAGLAPTPWQSGGTDREQGITKAGNPRIRRAMIELALLWLRHQPGSDLSRWFMARVGDGRGRIRRIAIVALARKLLVALWRYVTQGVVPQGAVFKA